MVRWPLTSRPVQTVSTNTLRYASDDHSLTANLSIILKLHRRNKMIFGWSRLPVGGNVLSSKASTTMRATGYLTQMPRGIAWGYLEHQSSSAPSQPLMVAFCAYETDPRSSWLQQWILRASLFAYHLRHCSLPYDNRNQSVLCRTENAY